MKNDLDMKYNYKKICDFIKNTEDALLGKVGQKLDSNLKDFLEKHLLEEVSSRDKI
jgi:hypothetical protein